MKKHLFACVSALPLAAVLCAAPAFAQQSANQDGTTSGPTSTAEDTGGLADIVVTAQKRAENLQDVPIAVTALAAEELKGANIEGQLTLPKLTPNLNFTVVASFASAYIRGVGTQFANPGLESSVSVYLDDIYLPRAVSGMFSFSDLERIEVLKGPQGTLYGRNATGGAIRIITHDPVPEFEGSAAVTYGTNNRLALDGVINLPITQGVALRLSARHDENDGYMKNIARTRKPGSFKRMQDRNEELYTAKLLLEPTDALTIKISGDYESKRDTEGNAFQNLFDTQPEQIGLVVGGIGRRSFYTLANDGAAFNRIKSYGMALRVDYDLGGVMLSEIAGYRHEDEHNCADLDATDAPLQESCGDQATKQFTNELQIASLSDGPFKYVAGLYYLREKAYYNFSVSGDSIDQGFGGLGTLLGLGSTGLTFSNFGRGVLTKSYAAYAQVDFEVSDQFTITAGGRYTSEKKTLLSNVGGLALHDQFGFALRDTFVGGIAGPCTAPAQVLCVAPRDALKIKRFTPKLTLSYKPNDDLLLYLTASRGFKSGGFNLPAFGAVDKVDPETLDNIEFGWKYQTRNFRFNGSAFYYKYDDLQIQLTDQTTGGTRVKNAAGARIKGVEMDLTYVLSDQLELGAGGGYLDAKYRNFIGDAYIPNTTFVAGCSGLTGTPGPFPPQCLGLSLVGGQNLSGNRLVNAPKLSGYLRGTFTQPLDDMGKVQLSSILNFRSKAYFDPANLFVDRRRALLSARLQWTSENERFSLGVFGENLTGKKYYVSRPAQATGGWQTPAAPRQIYVQAGVSF